MKQKMAIYLFALALVLITFFFIGTDKPSYAQIGDVQIAHKSMGQGKPVVLITGYSATMDMWDTSFLEMLSKNRRVIIFDNRGMGLSTSSGKEYSIELFADDTADLMDSLGIENADVIGWSLGTYIAQELALRHSGKVDRIVLYAADCGGEEAIMPTDEVLAKLSDTSGTEDERNERLVSMLFPPDFLAENPNPAKYMPNVKETSMPENIARQGDAWENWSGTCNRLSGLQHPTLLIAGSDDILTPPENSRIMSQLIPNSELEIVEGGGHGLMYQGLGFGERVETFLSR